MIALLIIAIVFASISVLVKFLGLFDTNSEIRYRGLAFFGILPAIFVIVILAIALGRV